MTVRPQLPTEIVELIADYLSLPDLRNWRFACRDVSAKIAGSRKFKSFCSKKAVELHVSSLRNLTAWLSEPGVQTYLEHLTVTGVLLVTKGLERIIREKTKPANLQDPCSIRRDDIGNEIRLPRIPVAQAEVDDAKSQLHDFRRQVREAGEEQAAGKDLYALVRLFQVIHTRCKGAGLKSLTLDVRVYREKTTALSPAVGAPWRQIWETAQHVLSVSLQAWHRSAIRIQHLDVYSETEDCSIQAYNIAALQKQLDFGSLYGLKALSMSISNRVLPLNPSEQINEIDKDENDIDGRRRRMRGARQLDEVRQQAARTLREERARMMRDLENVVGVAEWLRQTPGLEQLHLHNYRVINTLDTAGPALTSRKAIFKHIGESAPLPNLGKLTLRGADIEVNAVLKMLQNSPYLKSLSMQEVTLVASNGQSWDTVFACLTSPTAVLTHIYLDNLLEETTDWHNYIVCFTPGTKPGDSSISSGEDAKARLERLGVAHFDLCRPSARGYNAFELNRREDVLRGIEYWPNAQFVLGSVQNSMWREQRRRHYGPTGM